MKIIALILARGGSKGVPKKNIKLLDGKPLLSYVLEQAKQCEFFDEIVVSTDDDEIMNYMLNHGGPRTTTILRPAELATDESKSIDAVKHALSVVDADYIVLLNVCTPLTKATDIANCVKMALETKADSVVSLVEDFSCHPTKLCALSKDGTFTKVADFNFETGERQQQWKCHKRNTAIYLAKKEVIMSGTFFGKDTRGYVMPKERSWDINDQMDFDICEFLIKRNEN